MVIQVTQSRSEDAGFTCFASVPLKCVISRPCVKIAASLRAFLANRAEHMTSWRPGSQSFISRNSLTFMKTKVLYRLHKILLLVPVLSHMNIIRNSLIICSRFSPFTPRFAKWVSSVQVVSPKLCMDTFCWRAVWPAHLIFHCMYVRSMQVCTSTPLGPDVFPVTPFWTTSSLCCLHHGAHNSRHEQFLCLSVFQHSKTCRPIQQKVFSTEILPCRECPSKKMSENKCRPTAVA